MIITERELNRLREQFPEHSRVKLISMDDPYNTKLVPGEKGSVIHVDDTGTIHVSWDCGSSLGVVYGEDRCMKLSFDFNDKEMRQLFLEAFSRNLVQAELKDMIGFILESE